MKAWLDRGAVQTLGDLECGLELASIPPREETTENGPRPERELRADSNDQRNCFPTRLRICRLTFHFDGECAEQASKGKLAISRTASQGFPILRHPNVKE